MRYARTLMIVGSIAGLGACADEPPASDGSDAQTVRSWLAGCDVAAADEYRDGPVILDLSLPKGTELTPLSPADLVSTGLSSTRLTAREPKVIVRLSIDEGSNLGARSCSAISMVENGVDGSATLVVDDDSDPEV